MNFAEFLLEEYIIDEVEDYFSELSDSEWLELEEALLDDTVLEDELEEALSRMARIKVGQRMKKNAKKMQKTKEKKAKKMPSKSELMDRARKKVVSNLKTKFSKGKKDLGQKDKEKIEAKIKKMGPKIDKLAKKQFKNVKDAAKSKLETKTAE